MAVPTPCRPPAASVAGPPSPTSRIRGCSAARYSLSPLIFPPPRNPSRAELPVRPPPLPPHRADASDRPSAMPSPHACPARPAALRWSNGPPRRPARFSLARVLPHLLPLLASLSRALPSHHDRYPAEHAGDACELPLQIDDHHRDRLPVSCLLVEGIGLRRLESAGPAVFFVVVPTSGHRSPCSFRAPVFSVEHEIDTVVSSASSRTSSCPFPCSGRFAIVRCRSSSAGHHSAMVALVHDMLLPVRGRPALCTPQTDPLALPLSLSFLLTVLRHLPPPNLVAGAIPATIRSNPPLPRAPLLLLYLLVQLLAPNSAPKRRIGDQHGCCSSVTSPVMSLTLLNEI